MADSQHILRSIKKLLGLEEDYTAFDTDVQIHVNTALSTLQQLGVGPEEGFRITGDDETWDLFLEESGHRLEDVKSYIYLRVRLLFDPPPHAFLLTSLQDQIKEFEWRFTVKSDEIRLNQNGSSESDLEGVNQ